MDTIDDFMTEDEILDLNDEDAFEETFDGIDILEDIIL